MGFVLRCDGGCGTTTEHPERFYTHGYHIHRVYCEACHELVQDYEKARDEAHTRAAMNYALAMQKAEEEFYFALPNGILPDKQKRDA